MPHSSKYRCEIKQKVHGIHRINQIEIPKLLKPKEFGKICGKQEKQ